MQLNKTIHYSSNNELIKFIDLSFINSSTIEPFYGKGDIETLTKIKIDEKYDIDENCNCNIQDTLLNPPNYNNKFVLTNPPYLSKNKMNNTIKERYKHLMNTSINDLYQIFINQLINSNCLGGYLILPINFLFGRRAKLLHWLRQ